MLSVFFSAPEAYLAERTASSPCKRGRCCPFFSSLVWTASSPYKRGRCCPFFFFGPRGLTRRTYSISPMQKGEMLSFFSRPRLDSIFPLQKGEMLSFFSRPCLGPYSLKYSIFPLQKGEMLSIFLQPLLGRWAAKKIFIPLSPLSPLRGIDVSPWPHRDLEGCNPLKRARINA